MSTLSEKITAEHHYHPGVPVGQDCVCGEPLPGDIGPHLIEVTEAAVLASVKPSRLAVQDVVSDAVGYLPDSDKDRLVDAIIALLPGRSEALPEIAREGGRQS